MSLVSLALDNLLSPMVLFFALGLAAALARSDLTMPEAAAKLLALYLMMSIGFKGGAEIARHGADSTLLAGIAAGVVLSFLLPVIAYALLRAISRLTPVDAAAVAGHYGSISIVTFVAATGALTRLAMPYEGWLVAVAAAMETPAILTALLLARLGSDGGRQAEGAGAGQGSGHGLFREVALNGSVVVLLGAFAIGIVTGERGLATLKPFIVDPFAGFLCLFLLDMGLVAGRGLANGRRYLKPPVLAFGVLMPLIGGACAAVLAQAVGLSTGGTALFTVLGASASYIAVPAAMRLALPQANPSIALTLSLGVTFPFNLTAGIPLAIAAAQMFAA